MSRDVFSAHAVRNPDPQSELVLLESYAPDVGRKVLERCVSLAPVRYA
jgi:hypothetical protein